MRMGVSQRLVLLSVVVLVAVSFGFTALNFWLSRGWIEEDLKERAITFAREVAATFGDRWEFESTELLEGQIRQILTIRRNVIELDVLAFRADGTHVARRGRLPCSGLVPRLTAPTRCVEAPV